MRAPAISFSIVRHAAWAPGVETPEAWRRWSLAPEPLAGEGEPGVKQMPAMLRRRAGQLGKMALQVAYDCLDGNFGVPLVFCSRHGEVGRAMDLLGQLARAEALSPAAFGMAVHNATAGLFSIARADHANQVALAAGASSLEHALIEACGLLADGAPQVLLVAAECPLPEFLQQFEDCAEQPHAFAWLLAPAGKGCLTLSWQASAGDDAASAQQSTGPGTLDALRFYLSGVPELVRVAGGRRWRWSRDV
jgi:hypothetical protein